MLFNPLTDPVVNSLGKEVMLQAPQSTSSPPVELLKVIFGDTPKGLISSIGNPQKQVKVVIDPQSDRLQELQPFDAWDKKDYTGLHLLIKAKGKCTTDHISMAGIWLKYRGHLQNISQNLLIGAVNYFNEETNKVCNQLNGDYMAVPDAALAYRDNSVGSIIVGDENYGEGSSREHAAMEPRYLGVKAVLVKSFARIHETNLKKQGVLPLLFSKDADYDLIQEHDRIDIINLATLAPKKPLEMILHHKDGSEDKIVVNHTMNDAQIAWFRAGSALNLIKEEQYRRRD